jgi:hypothetical protein
MCECVDGVCSIEKLENGRIIKSKADERNKKRECDVTSGGADVYSRSMEHIFLIDRKIELDIVSL